MDGLKENFVSENIALLAKEHNFDKQCFGYYENSTWSLSPEYPNNTLLGLSNTRDRFTAPTYDQMINWFSNMGIEVQPVLVEQFNERKMWGFEVTGFGTNMDETDSYGSRKEALEGAFIVAFELLDRLAK